MADLWDLVLEGRTIDPEALARAVENQARQPGPDYRTRMLIRESVQALASHWGTARVDDWLANSNVRQEIERIQSEAADEIGFPTLPKRVVEPTRPEVIKQFLRELGLCVHTPTRLVVGGSVALILAGYLLRRTDDIDVADEVPASLRKEQNHLDQMADRYGIRLAHFQSHYLPQGWKDRLHYLDTYGSIEVYLVDMRDIFVGKLFSVRAKDRDDLRALAPRIDRSEVLDRVHRFEATDRLRQEAIDNWYILFGKTLTDGR